MGMWLSGCLDTRLMACGAPGKSIQILPSIFDNGVPSERMSEVDVVDPSLILFHLSTDVGLYLVLRRHDNLVYLYPIKR
jgi:hypothetical protein